jgi:hypothetical protein
MEMKVPEETVEERLGSWFVQWRFEGFSIRHEQGPHHDFFRFSRIILPVEIVSSGFFPSLDRMRLNVEPCARVEILLGLARPELDRFKQRLSAAVLGAVRKSPFGCSDCAAEAGKPDCMWDGTVCPSCREYYCRNSKCLRRLKLEVLRDGTMICKLCGVENVHAKPPVVLTPAPPTGRLPSLAHRLPILGRLLPGRKISV